MNTASSDSSKSQTFLLNEVVISSNRSSNQEFQTPNSIKILTSKQIKENSQRTTPEVLTGTNGVFIQKTNHGGGSPFLRGLTGNQTLLLIDGIRLNNSTFRYGPNQYFNTIDPFSIEKIEVLKNAGSVQYGSDALGGTIQVFTKEPDFEKKLSVNMVGRLATHHMEQTARAEIGFGKKNFAIIGSANFRNFGNLLGGKNTGFQKPSGYEEQSANLKMKFRIGKGVLSASHQYFAASNVPVYHKVVLENFFLNEFQPQKRNLSYLKFNQKNESKIFSEINIIASLQSTYEGRNSQKNNSSILIEESDRVSSKGFLTNISSNFSRKWSANTGIEIYDDLVKSTKLETNLLGATSPKMLRGLYPNNSTSLNYSVYSLHQFIQNKWQFSAGLRFNGFSINIKDETLGKINLSPKALVGNIAVLYNFTENLNSYFAYNSGFRSPNIDDLGTLGIVDFRYELPKYDLSPEKSDSFEFGVKLRSSNFSSTFALFYNKLNDLITRVRIPNQVINGYNVYQKENTESAVVKGLEYEFEAILNKKIKSYGGIAYTFGQNLTKNEPMRRIPPLFGFARIEYREKQLFIRPELLFASKQTRLAQGDIDDNRIGKNGTAAWQIINIQSGYIYKWLNINLLLQNILNADYRTHGSGINGVGRSAVLTLAVNI